MKPGFDLIVFDLDGTLVDSLPDLAAAANYALSRLGLPERPLEEHRLMIGAGEANYVRRFLGPKHQDLFAEALRLYLEYYSRHLGELCRVYPGVPETLAALLPRKMAVLSNKREDLTRKVVQVMGLKGFFVRVRGGDSYGTLKPDSAGLQALIRELQAQPPLTLMVGDKPEDVLTGRGAGTRTAALTSGYGEPEALMSAAPDYLLEDFSHLTALPGLSVS